MRILIDLDGVAADFYGALLKIYNKEFNRSLVPEDIKTWSLGSDVYPDTTEEYMRTYFDRPGFWSEMAPIPGAIESLEYLHSKGHELKIVTAVPLESRQCCYEKLVWVERHLPFIGHDNFYATLDKGGVRGDILFDDGPHNIKAFPNMTCVMDAAYNRNANGDFRVKTWDKFVSTIELITELGIKGIT